MCELAPAARGSQDAGSRNLVFTFQPSTLRSINVEHHPKPKVTVDNRIKGSLEATSETAKNDTIAGGKKAAFAAFPAKKFDSA